MDNDTEQQKGNPKARMTTEGFRIEPDLKKRISDHIATNKLDKSSVFRALAISTLEMDKEQLWELVKHYS